MTAGGGRSPGVQPDERRCDAIDARPACVCRVCTRPPGTEQDGYRIPCLCWSDEDDERLAHLDLERLAPQALRVELAAVLRALGWIGWCTWARGWLEDREMAVRAELHARVQRPTAARVAQR